MSDFNQIEYQTVILAALLHDVGKFVQRAKDKPKSHDHCYWGREWFDDKLAEKLTVVFSEKEKEIIRSAISNHHEYEKYIFLADAISAGMERIRLEDEEKGDPFTEQLISIFSRLSISEKPKREKYYRLTYLGKEDLQETFSVDEKICSVTEYAKLLNGFEKELEVIDFNNLSPDEIINILYFLLLKYLWCVPSAVYKDEPDISLFDHLKTTAAIAGCLYRYHREYPDKPIDIESPAFLLVGGDISGIQDYIFDVLTQQGKVAKRLRARSLFVQLISEIATHRIIHRFEFPLCNIISSAGGNFYVLLPNTQDANEKLQKLQAEFDKWTYENLKGELFITLGWIETNGERLGEFSKLFEDLKKITQERKYKPYQTLLLKNGGWLTERFLLAEVIQGDEKVCIGCYKHPIIDEKERLCEHCTIDIRIGAKLPKARYIAFFRNSKGDFPLLNYSFDIWADLLKDHSAYLVLSLNDTDVSGVGFKYIANHIPYAEDIKCSESEHEHGENPLAFFDCIANAAEGDKLLGYIKADVDNMGKLLRYGFHSEKPSEKFKIPNIKPSISRFSCFSRMLEIFFSGYLQRRLETDHRRLYTIFSGGDDLFIAGPWNKIIDFAQEMRKEFSRFTGDNPDLLIVNTFDPFFANKIDPLIYPL